MRSTGGDRGTFGKRESEGGPSASPSDERATAGRQGVAGSHDGSAPAKSPGLDLHPVRVRRHRFLSEIF